MIRLRAMAESEAGQSMAEFAMVLPMLALLTFGTLEVALYLQQQSAINAAAFMGARAASVLGNDAGLSQASLREFTDATGYPWLKNAKVKQESAASKSAYRLEAGAGRLTGIVSGLTGGGAGSLDTLQGYAALPLEYTARRFEAGKSPTYKPATAFMITYDAQGKEIPLLKNGAGAGLAMIAAVMGNLEKVAAKIPGMPPLSGFQGLKSTNNKEPFTTRSAVLPNPKARNNAGGDGGQLFSGDYLGPQLEERQRFADPKHYNINSLVADLRTYRDGLAGNNGIESACRKIGALPAPPDPLAAAAFKALKDTAAGVGKPLVAGTEGLYKAEALKEKQLFRR